MEDENRVVNPRFAGAGDAPEGWEFVAPRPALALRQRRDGGALELEGTGDRRAFGCWRGQARMEPGNWYRASVEATVRRIEDPALSLFVQVAQHFLVPVARDGDTISFAQTFPYRSAGDGDRFELYLRAAQQGRVVWRAPSVVRVEKPRHRIARVATVRFGEPGEALTLESHRRRIAEKLDLAGALKPDLVVLPEFCPIVGVSAEAYGSYWEASETVPDGPLCRLLAEKARRYGMHVLSGHIERRGDYLYNTAALFGRDGRFLGQYDKTHLTFFELMAGFSCGESYPLFDLDFGRIAVHICYDEWFPEVARFYAHAGAEILFLPVAGGKPITWRTRALDNGIYFVAASINPPSMIIGSSGAVLAETHDDGVAAADLNLDFRLTNWYGDPTLAYGMPCIVPQMRHRLDDTLLTELRARMTGG